MYSQAFEVPGRLTVYYRAFVDGRCGLSPNDSDQESQSFTMQNRARFDAAIFTNVAYAIGGRDAAFMAFAQEWIKRFQPKLAAVYPGGGWFYRNAEGTLKKMLREFDYRDTFVEDIFRRLVANGYGDEGDIFANGLISDPEYIPNLILEGIESDISPITGGTDAWTLRYVAAQAMQDAVASMPDSAWASVTVQWLWAMRSCCLPYRIATDPIVRAMVAEVRTLAREVAGYIAGEDGVEDWSRNVEEACRILESGVMSERQDTNVPQPDLARIAAQLDAFAGYMGDEGSYQVSERLRTSASLALGWLDSEDIGPNSDWLTDLAISYDISPSAIMGDPKEREIDALGAKLIR